MEKEKLRKSTRFLLFRVFLRSFFIQAVWNFERLLGFGLTYAMLPVIRLLYKDKGKRAQIVQEYLSCFNTHPYLAAVIMGMLINEEERQVKTGEFSREKIQNLKFKMMGPLGALGDTFFWAALRPFTALVSVFFIFLFWDKSKFAVLIIGMLFFFCFYNFFHILIRLAGVFKGYQMGFQIVGILKKIDLQKFVRILTGFGLMVVAIGLVVFPLNSSLFNLGELLNFGRIFNFFAGSAVFILITLLLSKVTPARMVLVLILLGELMAFCL